MRGAGARAGGGDAGGDSSESGDRLGEAGAAHDRSRDSNCARLEERDSEPELAGEAARSRRLRLAGQAHSRSDSLSSEPNKQVSLNAPRLYNTARRHEVTLVMTVTPKCICLNHSEHLELIQKKS